jgi:adenine deaminase
MSSFSIEGQYVDIQAREIYPARITVENQRITAIQKLHHAAPLFLMPGFIDAHVHIESSMLVPSEFARLAVVQGTVATVSDPHEIANVCGMEGVEYMINDGKQVNFKFYFGAPSCVPATPFETAGGEINAADIDALLAREEVVYLAEMMNWPGTVSKDPSVMEKIAIAQKYGKPVDGHAPGLRGDLAKKYASASISTDHECYTAEEALDKLGLGMKILIREGSAAKNFEALVDLIDEHADHLMFCSDDKHPDNLAVGHINELAARAVAKGKDLFDVLKIACVNPVYHYNLEVGQLKVGDLADFILVKDLKNFEVVQTFINGELVAEKGNALIPPVKRAIINNFHASTKVPSDFQITANGKKGRVIEALDGQLITPEIIEEIKVEEGMAFSNPERDILKIAVVNRYQNAKPAVAFVKNFGLQAGAIASSVAHDSHNIIVVGVDDVSIARAVNLVIGTKGGIVAVWEDKEKVLPLPVGGIMSVDDGYKVAERYMEIDRMAKEMGSTLQSPFMTLSFMALLVIPYLKLSDKGLFGGLDFQSKELFPSPESQL